MRKYLLTLTAVLFAIAIANAQYYYTFMDDGQNPKGVNKDNEPNDPTTAGWTIIWNGGATDIPAYTTKQSIPFPFEFNGNQVANYFASNFGVITFDDNTPTVKPSSYSNISLPSSEIADNSVCILGLKPKAASSYAGKSVVMTKNYGTAPYRQHWIYFSSFSEANIQNGWTHWAVVLEETSNSIYIVDMHTICVTSQAKFCSNNVKLSVGIQIDDATAYSISGSPNLSAKHPQTQGQIWTSEDNSFYRFDFGTRPNYSARVKSLDVEMYNSTSKGPFTIAANIQNTGSENFNTIEASYRIDDGAWVTETVQLSTVSVGNYTTVSHPTKWTPAKLGKQTIYFQIKKPNGNDDVVEDDDIISKEVIVFDKAEDKRTLIEVFTSSTCPPCKPGNERMKMFTDQLPADDYVYLKYQYNFPGSGDPYYTLEGRDRGTYYGGIPSVPSTTLNGGDKFNPNSITMSQIQEQTSLLSFIKVEAEAKVEWKDNIKVNINVTPYIDLPAGMKLHAAIVETTTVKNIKTNGEYEFHNVFKKFVWGAAGKTLPAINKDQVHNENGNFQVKGDYRLPPNAQTNIINWNIEHSIENFWNLGIVVFVQDNSTKEVLQATFTPLNMVTSVNQTELQKSLIVYPNPTNDMIYVNFNKADETSVTIRNIQGSVVYNGNFNFEKGTNAFSYDTKELADGVYTITLDYQEASVTQKLIVTH